MTLFYKTIPLTELRMKNKAQGYTSSECTSGIFRWKRQVLGCILFC